MKGKVLLASEPAMPLCEVLAHPGKYVGSEINVQGLYWRTPHERILHDPSCKRGEMAIQLADDDESLRMDGRLLRLSRATKGVTAVYRGLVVADPLIVGCPDDVCFTYRMTGARLLRYGDNAPRR